MNVKLTAQQKSKPIYTATDHASAPPCWAGLAPDVYGIMQPILLRENKQRRKQEYCWVSASPSCLLDRQAFSIAIQKNADFVIFVHNPRLTERDRHPAGKLQPSRVDKDATDLPTSWRLKAADTAYGSTGVVDIKVVDHFIISEKAYFSFVPN